MSYQKYYVPEDSKYPIYIATALFLLVMGAAGTINDLGKPESNSVYILYSAPGWATVDPAAQRNDA